MGLVSVEPFPPTLASPPTLTSSGQLDSIFPSPSSPLKTAVIVCKATRWDYEKSKLSVRLKGLGDDEVEKILSAKGRDGRSLRAKNDAQKQVEERIAHQLRKVGVESSSVSVASLPARLPPSTALIVSAGGDGTFLAAASLVSDNDTVVIGVNSDPHGSEGHLCLGCKTPPPDFSLLLHNPQWRLRSRLKVVLPSHSSSEQPLLALNDVFIGEIESAKVSYYDISVDGSPFMRQKSSGIVVCTGSGSSAWHSSINRVCPGTLPPIFAALRAHGISVPDDSVLAQKVAQTLNEQLVEKPDCNEFLFSVREPIFNLTFSPSPTHGKARKIRLRSRCSNAFLVLDGWKKVPWESGTVVTLEIDSRYSLKTLY